MEELKLMIYDKKRNKIFNLITWNHPNYLSFDVAATGQSPDSLIEIEKEDSELMIWSGKTDKHNRDIYTGHIIEFKSKGCNRDIHVIGVVRKRGIVFTTDNIVKKAVWILKHVPRAGAPTTRLDTQWSNENLLGQFPNNLEIIGNKWMNKNLLYCFSQNDKISYTLKKSLKSK